MTTTTLTSIQAQALEKVRALRHLTRETGSATTRSQNYILRALADPDLATVAVELSRDQQDGQ